MSLLLEDNQQAAIHDNKDTYMEAEISPAVDEPTCKLSLPFPCLLLKGHKHGLITTVKMVK
jgi:hypothetical protein